MKLRTTFFLAVFLLITSSAASALSITCSLFPVYDFARAITGENANIKLLIKPGVEPHEFEPSALDIKALNDADVFIFTGNLMEQWAEKISHTLTNTIVINASKNITLTGNDPHIWLDLSLAKKMINIILNELCKISPANAESFKQNAKSYCSKLAELDEKFMLAKKNIAEDKILVFAGEFSAQYFMKRYGFNYISAYDGENEPSIRKLANVIKFIRDNNAKYIFSEPLNISQITLSISHETNTEILTFNTAHNIENENITFLQIMNENYNNIIKALN